MTGPTTEYDRITSVEDVDHHGIRVTLNLQRRHALQEGTSWHCVSWRTQYVSGSNRRFYVVNGEPWTLPLRTALSLLDRLEEAGGLDKAYDLHAHENPPVVAVSDYEGEPQPPSEILIPGEDWGHAPQWLVLADGEWRKVMLVNLDTEMVTFRSTTTDQTYKPRKLLDPASGWFLDNSMQDASVEQTRMFHERLRTLSHG